MIFDSLAKTAFYKSTEMFWAKIVFIEVYLVFQLWAKFLCLLMEKVRQGCQKWFQNWNVSSGEFFFLNSCWIFLKIFFWQCAGNTGNIDEQFWQIWQFWLLRVNRNVISKIIFEQKCFFFIIFRFWAKIFQFSAFWWKICGVVGKTASQMSRGYISWRKIGPENPQNLSFSYWVQKILGLLVENFQQGYQGSFLHVQRNFWGKIAFCEKSKSFTVFDFCARCS